MILALSGRRIDAPHAEQPRFPLRNAEGVGLALRQLFIAHGATWLVSSAACGADLIALSEARKLGLRRKIVLPSGREKFRESSVVDRPGDWGDLYDQMIDELSATNDIVIANVQDGEDPFRIACRAILDEAAAIGEERRQDVGAVMVWDGNVRETPDYTAEFGQDARTRSMTVFEISTL